MKSYKYSFIFALFFTIAFMSCDMGTESKPSNEITTPAPTTPVNNAVNVPTTPQFEWTGAADNLQVSLGASIENPVYDVTVSGQTHTMPSGILLTGRIYYWRVGKSFSGGVSYCNASKFTTAP